jgi:hypothetical protein
MGAPDADTPAMTGPPLDGAARAGPSAGTGRARVAALLRAVLGVVALGAFLSLAVQLADLVGSRGLLPLAEFLEAYRRAGAGWPARLHGFPTLFWIDPSDAGLRLVPLAGAAISILLILGIGGRAVPALLWLLYLSCVVAGRDFFYYQWDNLLLETLLLAVFLPARGGLLDLLRGRALPEPSPVVWFLLRWLLFRLLFESGLAKILHGRDDWLRLTAMTIYYETAPLPSWCGWLAHQMPLWFHRLSVLFTFLVELPLAICVFLPRPFRLVFFAAHLPFQVSIGLTSNYGFFNFLSLALSLAVLEDRDLAAAARWPARLLRRARGSGARARPADAGAPRPAADPGAHGRAADAPPPRAAAIRSLPARAPWLLAALVVPASLLQASNYFLRGTGFDRALDGWRAWYAPFRSVNVYHLFPGIVKEKVVAEIEGTIDGLAWRPYRFHYAPGDPTVPPPTTWLHNPRFPFHYSFYTLGRGRRDQEYIQGLAARLCCDPRAVSGLVSENPFPERGPAALRLSLYRYRFGSLEDLRRTGAYWLREPAGPPTRAYACSCPPGG